MSARKSVRFGDCVCLAVPDVGGFVHCDSNVSASAYVDAKPKFDSSFTSNDLFRARMVLRPKLAYTAARSAKEHSRETRCRDVRPTFECSKRLVFEEKCLNNRELSRSHGDVVYFGNVIQIQDFSGKYFTQVKNTSEGNTMAMKTVLSLDGDEGSWWKVIPAKVVRTEGDPVRYGDKMVFQSMKFHNCYLSVGDFPTGYPIAVASAVPECDFVRKHPPCTRRFEVHSSPQAQEMQIFPLTQTTEAHGPDIMRGFSTVVFQHKLDGTFLWADRDGTGVLWIGGSDEEQWNQPNCLWRVSKITTSDSGSAVKAWYDSVLLQHVNSGRYLQINADGKVVLGADFESKDCAWKLADEYGAEEPSRDAKTISTSDYIWLSSEGATVAGSGAVWLSSEACSHGDCAERREESRIGRGEQSGWALRLCKSMLDRDAVEVLVVSAAKAKAAEQLADCHHVLTQLQSSLAQCAPMPTEASGDNKVRLFAGSDIAKVMTRFKPWVEVCLTLLINGVHVLMKPTPSCAKGRLCRSTKPGSDRYAGPRRMRATERSSCVRPADVVCACQAGLLSVSEAIIRVLFDHLHLPLMHTSKHLPLVLRPCRLLYRLMQQAAVQNRANKQALLSFFPHMHAHRFAEIGSYFAWAELFKDTPEVLHAISDAHLAEFFDLVYKRQSERIVTILIQSCHIAEQPIPQNQDRITRWLLERIEAAPVISVAADDVTMSFPLTPQIGTVSTRELFRQGEDAVMGADLLQVSKPAFAFRFALKMLELYGWLVLGRNVPALQMIFRVAERLGLSLPQLQTMLTCEHLPWCLRAVCCDLLRRLYVDAPPNAPAQLLVLTRVLRLNHDEISKTPSAQGGPGTSGSRQLHERASGLSGVIVDNWTAPTVNRTASSGRRASVEEATVAAVRESIEELVTSWHSVDLLDLAKNRFVLAVVRLLLAMTEQGLYHTWSDEEQELVPETAKMMKVASASMNLMCGRTDATDAFKGRELHRFAQCSENDVIVEIKSTLLDLTRCYRLICDNARITRALDLFRAGIRRASRDASPPEWESSPPWTREGLHELQRNMFSFEEEFYSAAVIDRGWLGSVVQPNGALNLPEAVSILLDMMRYEYPALQERAMMRLVSLFSQSARFMEHMSSVQLLCAPQSVAAHDQIRGDVRFLGEAARQLQFEHIELFNVDELEQTRTAVRGWRDLFTAGADHERRAEVARMIHGLGGTAVLVGLLSRGGGRQPGAVAGCADRARCPARRDLLGEVCALLALMCSSSPQVKEVLTSHHEVLWELVGIDSLDVEVLLQAVVDGDSEAVLLFGTAWIHKVFEALVRFHRDRNARLLLVLESILACRTRLSKEHQSLTVTLLRNYQRTVLDPAGEKLTLTGDEGHDERTRQAIDASCVPSCAFRRSDHTLAFHLAVIRVLSSCTRGMNPITEVLAANMLPVRECVRAITGRSRMSDGTVKQVRADIQLHIKEAYLRFLHDVYSESNVENLKQQFEALDAILWPSEAELSQDWSSSDGKPLMLDVLEDLQACARLTPKSEHSGTMDPATRQALLAYVHEAVIPMVTFFYKEHPAAQTALPQIAALSATLSHLDCRTSSFMWCESVGWHGRARQAATPITKLVADNEHSAVPGSHTKIDTAWIRHGWQALCKDVRKELGEVAGGTEVMAPGMQHLAMLLAHNKPLPVYENLVSALPKLHNPPDPAAEDILIALLGVCAHEESRSEALCHLLALTRAALYLHDPAQRCRVPSDCEEEWQAMISCEPMTKSSAEVLAHVQNRFDAMGCTKAAMGLTTHQCCKVRRNAVLLLLALLQDKNRCVQTTIARFFDDSQDFSFFRTVEEEITRSVEKVAAVQLYVKAKRSDLEATGCACSREEEDFGRTSLVVLQLRLVQFMCEGQFGALQNATVRQTRGGGGYNLVKSCAELLLVMQPWVADSLRVGRVDVALLCLQTTDTLSEMMQGPNETIRAAILSTSFLVTANALLERLAYNSQDPDYTHRVDGVGISEIKCWLKRSTLACCSALFESQAPGHSPQAWLGNLSVEQLGTQIDNCASLLKAEQSPPSPSGVARGFAGTFTFKSPQRSHRDGFRAHWKEMLEGEMFQAFTLLLCMREMDQTGSVERRMALMAEQSPARYAELEGQCRHVELVRTPKEGERQRVDKVFFRVDADLLRLAMSPECRARAEEVFLDVPRKNPHEKCKAFLARSKALLRRLHWFTHCSADPVLRVLIRYRHLLNAAPFLSAICVTLFLLAVYGIPVDPNTGEILGGGRFRPSPAHQASYGIVSEAYAFARQTSHPDTTGSTVGSVVDQSDLSLRYRLSLSSRWLRTEEWAFFPAGRWIALALACLQTAVTLLNAVAYVVLDLPVVIVHAMEAQHPHDAGASSVSALRLKSCDCRAAPDGSHQQQRIVQVAQRGWRLAGCCVPALYFALLCCLSVLGTVSSPLLQVFLILDYFRQKDGKMVLKSVVLGGPNLLRSMVLGILVMVCFGFYTYAYFTQAVMFHHDLCHSPFQCVSKHILDTVTGDLSTVLGDNFGGFSTPAMVVWEDLWEAWRSLFVFLSILFWVFLLQGIIQGQIIDAFAEMRSETTTKADDLKDRCFISSIERFKFAPFPGEWEQRRQGRYAWNYILYFSFLQNRDPQEYNGIESEVAALYEREDISFMPVGVFRGPHGRGIDEASKDDRESSAQDRLGAVEEALRGCQTQLKALQACIAHRLPPQTSSASLGPISEES